MAAENKASFATRCRNRLESGAREEGRVFPAGSPSGYSPVQTTSNGSVPLEGIPTLSSSEQRPILVHRNGPVQQNSTRSQIEKSVHELKNYEPQWESGSADDPLDNNSADLQPIMVIDQIGDAVLQLMDRDGSSVSKYRVSSEQLKKVSGYFDAMLTPGKFSESTQFYSQIEALKSKFDGDCGKAPAAKLPILSFPEVMELTLSKSTTQALTALLLLSHGQTDMKEKQSVNSMAHLAVIAEQVLATDITRQYVLTYLRKLKAKSPRWSPVVQDKEKWRQLVYLGYVYDDIEVFAWFSALLIDHGPDIVVEHNPEKHSKKENSRARTRTESEIIPPWFNLPNDMEDELYSRRHYILRTLASIPQSLLRPYLSNPRVIPNCKLGYDTSPHCDSFQLGEALRFLVRKSLLSSNLHLTITPDALEPLQHTGRLTALIKSMKEMPNHQLNAHHHHCGIRGLLVNRLNGIESFLAWEGQAGLCVRCWKDKTPGSSWVRDHKGGTWRGAAEPRKMRVPLMNLGRCGYAGVHEFFCRVFTADEWDWIDRAEDKTSELTWA
ncbi:MAG: hypothetical protein LQ340_004290 [Diploschistes diacapsis]|nr:MAG: hypothetical protein LQ340_004290 [Diploschistes diacapsis]